MHYLDKFVRVTNPEHPQFGKAGIVLVDYEDGTVLAYFRGRQKLVLDVADLIVLEGY